MRISDWSSDVCSSDLEFGVLARDVDFEGVQLLAERLRTRIEGLIYVWEQRSYTISASIGVVMIDRAGLTLEDVFAHADAACYMAKDHGRNQLGRAHVCTPVTNAHLGCRLLLEKT